MSNPSRQKGTTEETAIVNKWNTEFGDEPARRMPAAAAFDITVELEKPIHPPIEILSTRADRGERLYTLRENDFMTLFSGYEFHERTPIHIESKRYARFSLHAIFEKKFGKKK